MLQGNSKTNWILVIPIGIIYFFLYYFSFRYLIKKFDLKTPGRETNNKLLILKKPNLCDNKNIIDKQSQLIIRGLGGRDNFNDLDCCITRLRVTVNDNTKLNEGLLKQSGAAAIITQGNSVQIIYGPKASSIKTKLNEYLSNVPVEYDEYKEEIVYNQSCIELGNIVDGEVMPIESSCDQIFSHKLMGDGVIIKPHNGLIVSPCDGVITMIYPTKHAVGIKLDNGCELLLHFGIDTVNLNGNGFEVLVKINQRINKGDLILNADLEYIREKATSDQVILVITKIVDNLKIEKNYGEMKRGTVILKILS